MKLLCRLAIVGGFLVLSVEAGRATEVDGLALMKVEPAARAAGMAGAFVSIGGDPNSSAYNPAGVINSNEFVASFGHNQYWENARIETGYFALRFSPKVFSHVGIRFASIGDIQSRQIPSASPAELFQANDLSAKAGLTYQVHPRVAIGASVGWFFEKIGEYRGSAFNLDLGALATLPNHITVGAAVQNIGSKFRLENAGEPGSDDITLPLTYRLGASYKYRDYLGAADLVVIDDKAHLHLGAEANVHESLRLRAGYMFGYDSKNFTAGASFLYRNLTFDYAFVPYTNNLGTTHLFNLTFRV
jgi:hypothetical protein